MRHWPEEECGRVAEGGTVRSRSRETKRGSLWAYEMRSKVDTTEVHYLLRLRRGTQALGLAWESAAAGVGQAQAQPAGPLPPYSLVGISMINEARSKCDSGPCGFLF